MSCADPVALSFPIPHTCPNDDVQVAEVTRRITVSSRGSATASRLLADGWLAVHTFGTYTSDEMVTRWPELQVARDKHRGNHPYNWPSAGYGYHVEVGGPDLCPRVSPRDHQRMPRAPSKAPVCGSCQTHDTFKTNRRHPSRTTTRKMLLA